MDAPLKRLREHLNLSHAEMARAIGCSRARIYQVEAGDGNLRVKTLRRVFDLYQTELDKLQISREDVLLWPGYGDAA